MSSGRAGHPAALEIDCRGLLCPLPVLETEKALQQVTVGQCVLTLCTDPAAELDLAALCAREGHELLRTERSGTVIRIWIEKSPSAPTRQSSSDGDRR